MPSKSCTSPIPFQRRAGRHPTLAIFGSPSTTPLASSSQFQDLQPSQDKHYMSRLRFRPLQRWAHTAGLLLVPDRPHLLSSTFPPTRYPTAHSGLEPAEVPICKNDSENESNNTTSLTNHPLRLGPQPPSTPFEPPTSPTPPNTIPPSLPHILPHSSSAYPPPSLAARAGQGRAGQAG